MEVEATCSPSVQQKVIAAATTCASYSEASQQLQNLAEIEMGEKRIARLAQRLGNERVEEREQQLEEYQALPLPERNVVPPTAPQGQWQNRVAVVMVDGGRAQLRDERWGMPRLPLVKKPSWWKEPKMAMLATFSSERSDSDPLSDVPECLLDPLWLIPRINEIKAARGGESAAEELDDDTLQSAVDPGEAPPQNRWSPPPLVRSYVATFEPYEHLGELAEVEAYHRGFVGTDRKAFLGDGLPSNWTIQQKRFSTYTPILDLMHALSYVYQAAQAASIDMEHCWQRCQSWVTLTWQGKVAQVIGAIDGLIEAAEEESVLATLHESRQYLSNNQDRMKYAYYRQQGLPITTALMESSIKQGNRRMKGTEKFWSDGAEPQLQLCADTMSETQPLTSFWQDRSAKQTGFRKSRAR